MTFIVGMNTSEGLILCADRLEGDSYNKRFVNKLYQYSVGGEWLLTLGASGSSSTIKSFWDKLKSGLGNEAFDKSATESIIEGCLKSINQQHPEENIAIVCGLVNLPTREHFLYRSWPGYHCLAPEKGYACVGMENPLSTFLLDTLFHHFMELDEAVKLAVFVTGVMKVWADGVGGQTDLFEYRKYEQQHPLKIYTHTETQGMEENISPAMLADSIKSFWRSHTPELDQSFLRSFDVNQPKETNAAPKKSTFETSEGQP